MKWKEIVTDYLTFTRKEQIGIITVLLILLISIFLPNFYSHYDGTRREIPDTTWMVAVRKLEQKQAGNEKTFLMKMKAILLHTNTTGPNPIITITRLVENCFILTLIAFQKMVGKN